ncbi:MerR family transcriptional regulator [bacterium]|jgi:DNA-binding transcriptional MerR regulator|nr:MerR family transcriptional regulator [bacterium]
MNTEYSKNPELMSLEQLSQEVARLLQAEYGISDSAARDQRVSSLPDARTIRYYTTLGLLDRPFIDGRQARYGQRHVLQLLAVKALQSMQFPLARVQEKLYGLTESELKSLLQSIASSNKERKHSQAAMPAAIVYREIILEPGLKLTVADGYKSNLSIEALRERIEIALKVLSNATEN